MFKHLALAAIGMYQRHLSPRKGYSCAYRVGAGGTGCSGFGKHAISKHGLVLGLILLRRRFAKCAWHAQKHQVCTPRATQMQPAFSQSMGRFSRQGGFADCSGADCNGCDVPSCDMPDFGCCDGPKGSGGKSSAWCAPDLCSGYTSSGSRHSSSACRTPSCCASRSGAQREDDRLEDVRVRREEGSAKAASGAQVSRVSLKKKGKRTARGSW